MAYIENRPMKVPSIAMPARGSLRNAASRIFHVMFDRPLRAWSNSRDLHEISQLDPAQLRDIGLTPYDVAAARLAPFHVSAGLMLAHLAERRRLSGDSADSAAVQPTSSERESA